MINHNPTLNTSTANTSDVFGGQNITVDLAIPYDAQELLNWVRGYRKQIEQEEKLRREIPHVQEAWDSYQITLKLAQE